MTHWRPLPLPNLAPGRHGDSVLHALQSLTAEATNARGSGPDYQTALTKYLDFISHAESQLRSIFSGDEAVIALHTPRYWFLLGLDSAAQPWRILQPELDLQISLLDRYVQQLRHEIEVFRLDEGELAVVLDTNFFLHFDQIDQIRWSEHLPAKGHRIVIPAVVIKELDDKKYHQAEKLSRRARSTIRFLYQLRGEAHPEEPVSLKARPSVRVQILLDPAGHRRSASADDEILDRGEHLAGVAGGGLVVASADYGIHLAADVRGLGTWRPDDSLRRDRNATTQD